MALMLLSSLGLTFPGLSPVQAQIRQAQIRQAQTETSLPSPRTILFVGNSFTFGATSPVRYYGATKVDDLNGENIGGVPALFQRMTEQAGLSYAVSLETSGGKDLSWHLTQKSDVIIRPWDVVVLQTYSTLDAQKPGDPASLIASAGALSRALRAQNAKVDIYLEAT